MKKILLIILLLLTLSWIGLLIWLRKRRMNISAGETFRIQYFDHIKAQLLQEGFSGVAPPPVRGCTDPFADNYNPNATEYDGSCSYSEGFIYGCTNPAASNYNPDATFDDGSCVFASDVPGCTDPEALNYDPDATVDDSSCVYDTVGDPNYIDIICSNTPLTTTVEYIPGYSFDLYKETCNVNNNRPVVICLHPGGADRTEFSTVKYAKEFASRGYIGICADYKDSIGHFTATKQHDAITRVCALIRYLRVNAATYGIKKENIFVLGISAGAITAVQTNISANDLDAHVPYFDSSLNSLYNTESSIPVASATQSGSANTIIQNYIATGDHPNYFYHGTLDHTVSYSGALTTYNLMLAKSIAATFVPYPGEGHKLNGHHDDIMLGGSTDINGNSDIGIVRKFALLLT